MAWIDESDLKQIAAQADIADVIGSYLPLEKKGKNYRAVCPFHDDHDPSLQVNTTRQRFKCFVCGTGGDVFSFVQNYEKISFPEAVRKIADLIHYPLKGALAAAVKKVSPQQPLYDALHNYILFCQYELKSQDGQQALSYCQQRKISPELIERFEIGYAPGSRQSLHFLNSKKIPASQQLETGLIYEGVNPRAVFDSRLMIPIHDPSGNPVGFTARRLNDQSDEAKYINTRDTVLYDKSSLIFNYHRAKAASRKARRVILCEGAMDVIAMAKAGLDEAIANLGTACTDRQIELIRQLRVPVVVCYDNDKAGKAATYKFAQKAVKAGLRFSIVHGSSQKDPDEVFLAHGAQEVQAMVEKTIGYIDFLLDYLPNIYNLDNYDDKKSLAEIIKDAIDQSASQIEKGTYLHRLKELTGFDFTQEQPRRTQKQARTFRLPQYVPSVRLGLDQAQQILLQLMLESKTITTRFQDEIGFFPDEVYQTLSLYIYDFYRSSDQIDRYALLSTIEEPEILQQLLSLYDLEPIPEEVAYPLFVDAMNKLRECALNRQIEDLNEQIQAAADIASKTKLALRKQELIRQRNAVYDQKEG